MTGKILTSRDPVCGMDVTVANSHYSTTHRGLVFHFCSEQCRERFTQNPALYTGPQRTVDIHPIPKKRELRFVSPAPEALRNACELLLKMMGVTVAQPSNGHLHVEYDLRQATLAQIEAAVTSAGLSLNGGLHGLRRNWWRFTELNELDNAADVGSSACCNRPPARLH